MAPGFAGLSLGRIVLILLVAVAVGVGVQQLIHRLTAPGPEDLDRTIEGALQEIAAGLGPFPRQVDTITRMTGASARGRTLTYRYQVREAPDFEAQRERLRTMVCDEPSMRGAIARYQVRYTYEYWSEATPPERLAEITVSDCP